MSSVEHAVGLLTCQWRFGRILETKQFHVLWRVAPKKMFGRPNIEEKEFEAILRKHVGKKPYEICWIQAYIKRETRPGDLCLILLQKNQKGCHVNPKMGELDSKADVIFYKEVQKTMPDKIFEGDNFQIVYPKPIKFSVSDRLNVDFKASNSSWRPRTVDFLWTIGFEVEG